jgi:hypothetical protein
MDKVDSGQAVLEYVLLLAIIVALYGAVINLLTQSRVFESVKAPFVKEYVYIYQFGHKDARGADGGPIYIPQHHDPEQNFRIFINPPISP